MLTCPSCKSTYPEGTEVCAKDRSSLILVDEDEISVSDTLRHTPAEGELMANGGGAPIVRLSGSNKLPAAADPIVGTKLAERYEVTRKIGEGGMGAVYEARHLLIGKRVAIKVLLDKYAQKADVVARLQQEARLASSIGHEHIVDITDFGETSDGRTFVVMEFLDGESLAQLITREGPMPPRRAVTIVRQVASALGAAHGKGIVHRDVKPENVFITRRGNDDYVKVVDFGISKAMRTTEEAQADAVQSSPRLTQTGMVLGTPLYMSPEQARGEDQLDHRIDVYAVGVILYEALTGETPYRGANYLSIISQVISVDPKRPCEHRPDLSPALEAVVLKAMAKDRAQRYQTMNELDADLERFESGSQVKAIAHILSGVKKRKTSTIFAWVGGVGAVAAAVALIVPKVVAPRKVIVQQVAAPPAPPPPDPKIKTVEIDIDSDPPGAEVWLGSVDEGKAPAHVFLPMDKARADFTLKLEGYADATVPVFPTENQTKKGTLTPLPPPAPPASSAVVSKPSVNVVRSKSVPPPKPVASSAAPTTDDGEEPPTPYHDKKP